jgi:hypothetical protein
LFHPSYVKWFLKLTEPNTNVSRWKIFIASASKSGTGLAQSVQLVVNGLNDRESIPYKSTNILFLNHMQAVPGPYRYSGIMGTVVPCPGGKLGVAADHTPTYNTEVRRA